MKLPEIAGKIAAHLQRFENDPEINKRREANKLLPYHWAGARATKRHVSVVYVSFQGPSYLSKAEALEYLAWLDAGNVGRHFKMQHDKREE
jgi:hypothetical protein